MLESNLKVFFLKFYLIYFFNNKNITRWAFSKLLCQLLGCLMYFVGCMQIFTMAAISFERYYILKNPYDARKLDNKIMIKIILICLLLSLFWSIVPLFGWSYYSLEDSLTGCCVEYKSRKISVISYNVAMFLFVFIIPFCFILITNIKLFFIVSNLSI